SGPVAGYSATPVERPCGIPDHSTSRLLAQSLLQSLAVDCRGTRARRLSHLRAQRGCGQRNARGAARFSGAVWPLFIALGVGALRRRVAQTASHELRAARTSELDGIA